MREHKGDLAGMSTRQLLARRRALAARLADAEQMLVGSLVEQTRRAPASPAAGARSASRMARMPTSRPGPPAGGG